MANYALTTWNLTNGSVCPIGLKDGFVLYPGQVISVYAYLCDGASVKPVYPTLSVIPPTDKAGNSSVYYATHFDDQEYFNITKTPNATMIDFGILQPNASSPGRFGMWPGAADDNIVYKLNATFGNVSVFISFTFVQPEAYVKFPPGGGCHGEQIVSLQGTPPLGYSCNVSYAASPMLPGKYGVLSLVSPSASGGSQDDVFSDGEDGDAMDLKMYTGDSANEGPLINFAVSDSSAEGDPITYVTDLPKAVDSTQSLVYDLMEDGVFLAFYASSTSFLDFNLTDFNSTDFNLTQVNNVTNYAMPTTVFWNYLMVKPDFHRNFSESGSYSFINGSEAFYVPVMNGIFKQTMDMSANVSDPSSNFYGWLARKSLKLARKRVQKVMKSSKKARKAAIKNVKVEIKKILPKKVGSDDGEDGEDGELFSAWYVCPDDGDVDDGDAFLPSAEDVLDAVLAEELKSGSASFEIDDL